jgi:micrococcal nuclease
MIVFRLFFTALILLWGPETSIAEPLVSGGSATVIEVIDGDTVILDGEIEGSNEVRLVGIQAPKLPLGRKGFKKWPLADESKKKLEKLTLGQTLDLKFGGRRMDRHGRLLAHLFTKQGQWIQGDMISAGMARVYSFPDNRAVVADMLKLENAARNSNSGIWDDAYYQVRKADNLVDLIGTFQLVEGVIIDTAIVRGTTYLNFADDWRSDFTITLKKRALATFIEAGLDPLLLKGKSVRVRGWLKKRNGPMIEATHPEQLELMQ